MSRFPRGDGYFHDVVTYWGGKVGEAMAESFGRCRVDYQEDLAFSRRRGSNHRGDTSRVALEIRMAVKWRCLTLC